MMASSSKDEVFEFADKNYKIIKKTVEKVKFCDFVLFRALSQ